MLAAISLARPLSSSAITRLPVPSNATPDGLFSSAPLAGTPTVALGAGPWVALGVLGVLGSGMAYVLMHRFMRRFR